MIAISSISSLSLQIKSRAICRDEQRPLIAKCGPRAVARARRAHTKKHTHADRKTIQIERVTAVVASSLLKETQTSTNRSNAICCYSNCIYSVRNRFSVVR